MSKRLTVWRPALLDGFGRARRRLRPGPRPAARARGRRRRRRRGRGESDAAAPEQPERRRSRSPAPARTSAPGPTSSSGARACRNIVRQTPQVISVLSSEDIARTGEGDIAGALQRVTGLSVVGNGFVYRPRPRRPLFAGPAQRLAAAEPRAAAPRRAARHLPDQRHRQLARPEELFGQLSGRVRRRRDQPHHPGGAARDLPRRRRRAPPPTSRSTFQLGYSYYRRDLDPLGFDDGTRDFPAALRNAVVGRHLHRRPPTPSAATSPPASRNAEDHPAPADGRHARQFLGRRQRRHLDRRSAAAASASSPRPATATAGAPATRSSRPRTIPISPAPRRPASRRSPPTTGSSSTACSASAPNSATTASAGPTSTSATR